MMPQKGVDVEAMKKIVPYNSVEVKVGGMPCHWCHPLCKQTSSISCATMRS